MRTTVLRKIVASLSGQDYSSLLVSDGRVHCPRATQADVDVDRCYSCSFLTRNTVDTKTDRQWIECRRPCSPSHSPIAYLPR